MVDKKLLLGIFIGAVGGGTIGGIAYVVDIEYEGETMVIEAGVGDNHLICRVDFDLELLE